MLQFRSTMRRVAGLLLCVLTAVAAGVALGVVLRLMGAV